MILYVLGSLALFSLPFIPTLIEIFRRTDIAKLKITDQILHDPRDQAELVFWHLARTLNFQDLESFQQFLEKADFDSTNESTWIRPAPSSWNKITQSYTRVLSAEPLQLPGSQAILQKIYSFEAIEVGEGCVVSEVHSKKTLRLGAGARLAWWASARQIEVSDRCEMPGKVSGSLRVQVGLGVRFHLIEAPEIVSVFWNDWGASEGSFHAGDERLVFKGNTQTQENSQYEGSLIVRGDLHLKSGTVVRGGVKCHGKLVIDPGVKISGNVLALKSIQTHGQIRIFGSLIASQSIECFGSIEVGERGQMEMVSAKYLSLSTQFRVHGSIRAWKVGYTGTKESLPAN